MFYNFIIKYTDIFVDKMRKVLHCNSFSHFSNKNIGIFEIISILDGCMVWIEKSVMRVPDRHHEACRVMQNSDPE